MDYQIIVAPRARYDLGEAWRYISRDSFLAAERFTRLLCSKTKMLGAHPEIGRVVPEIGNHRMREIIVKNYQVIYEIDFSKEKVEILRYWHAVRCIPDITF